MEWFLGLAAVVILIGGLCNPRLRRDMKSGRSSMDDVLDQGRADLKDALRARKGKKKDGED